MVRKVSLAREPMCRGTIKQITDALALTRRNSMYDEITVGLCVTLETQTRALVSSPIPVLFPPQESYKDTESGGSPCCVSGCCRGGAELLPDAKGLWGPDPVEGEGGTNRQVYRAQWGRLADPLGVQYHLYTSQWLYYNDCDTMKGTSNHPPGRCCRWCCHRRHAGGTRHLLGAPVPLVLHVGRRRPRSRTSPCQSRASPRARSH